MKDICLKSYFLFPLCQAEKQMHSLVNILSEQQKSHRGAATGEKNFGGLAACMACSSGAGAFLGNFQEISPLFDSEKVLIQ